MEFNIEHLKPLAEELANLIGNELEKADQLTSRQIEEDLRAGLRALGQLAYGLVLSQQDRWYERELACECGRGKAPLDEQLGLAPGQVTAGLAALIGLAGSELAFEYSSRFLEPFLLFRVSENTIRQEAQRFGQLQSQREEQLVVQSQMWPICRNACVRQKPPQSGSMAQSMAPTCALKNARAVIPQRRNGAR